MGKLSSIDMKNFVLIVTLFTPLFINAQSINLPSFDNVAHFVSYSPDGNHAIAKTADRTLGVWDMNTGKLIHTLNHNERVRDGIYDPAGKYILTYSNTYGIRPKYEGASLWDSKTGMLLYKLDEHTAAITTIDFSPLGDKLITGSNDSTAKIWNVSTGALIYSLEGHNGTIEFVKFSPDGKKIATTSTDKTAKIWDSNKGTLLYTLTKHTDKVDYATFSSDGKTLFTGSSDELVNIWETETGNYIQTLSGHPEKVSFIAFSPNEKYLLTLASGLARINNTIMIWDAKSLDLVHKIEGDIRNDAATGHRKYISAAIFSNDSKRLITSSFDKTVKIWDTRTGTLIKSINYYMPDLSIHPSKNRFIGAALNGFIVYDAESWNSIIQLNTVDDSPDKWIHVYDGKYIDTQDDVMPRIRVLEGGESHPFSKYKNEYHVPGLWSRVMQGDTSFVK